MDDPKALFHPSPSLCEMVNAHRVRPPSRLSDLLQLPKELLPAMPNDSDSTQISDAIEGVLADLARDAIATGTPVVTLADRRQLEPDFRAELFAALDLDSKDLKVVWERLLYELFKFASITRMRSWGNVDSTKLVLRITVDLTASELPDLEI